MMDGSQVWLLGLKVFSSVIVSGLNAYCLYASRGLFRLLCCGPKVKVEMHLADENTKHA